MILLQVKINSEGLVYSREELLGNGSYGTCYKFRNEISKEDVAIKVVSKFSSFAMKNMDKAIRPPIRSLIYASRFSGASRDFDPLETGAPSYRPPIQLF
ncbi:MAG: hypothetical protein QM709_16075 [Spongiibacteraceae bacterium]